MPLFRKKPVVVEAIQWFPPGDSRHDESKWKIDHDGTTKAYGTIACHLRMENVQVGSVSSVTYRLATLGGWRDLAAGDWIVQSEFYPIKPDEFSRDYEPADSPPSPGREERIKRLVEAAKNVLTPCSACDGEGVREIAFNGKMVSCDCCGGHEDGKGMGFDFSGDDLRELRAALHEYEKAGEVSPK